MSLIYAEHGINWFFPYEVEFEDDDILVLKELPRQHKYDTSRGADMHVDKWIVLNRDSALVPTTGEQYSTCRTKLCEVKQ